MTKTAATRRALKYWGNVVKNYDGIVFDEDFFDLVAYNLKRDEVAAIIRGNFPAKDLRPLMEAKEEKLELDGDRIGFMLRRIWNEKPLRKQCRFVLSIMRERIMRALATGEEDRLFERRFRELCRFLKLDRTEADLLMLMYVRYGTIFDDFPEDDFSANVPIYYAMAVDRAYAEVQTALGRRGRLARYNCMTDDYRFNYGELGGYFDGVDGVPLDERYYVESSEEPLPWDFFGRLATDDGAILGEMLAARKSGGRLNVLLYGVPGSGKTSFARALAAKAGFKAYDLLQGGAEGKDISPMTRMAGIQIFNARMSDGGRLLVVDEADELLRTSGSVFGARIRGGSEKGVINTILDGMKTPAIWISNAPAEEMDESVRRRFDYSVRFHPLTLAQRERIWRNNIRRLDMSGLVPEASAAALAERYETSAGGITMVLENVRRMNPGADRAGDLIERIMRPHCELMMTPVQDGRDSPAADYSLKGLNIKGGVALDMVERAAKNFRAEAEGRGPRPADSPRMTILLWGPPGTGKTEYVKYLAKRLGTKVVTKMGSDLLDMYVGGTEARIRDAFAEAEAEKALLFLDEIDGLVQSRRDADHSWEVTQVNELLHQMERFGGVMVGATNFFDRLDKAVLRRFTFKIEFGYLDDDGKALFFERMFKTSLSEKDRTRLAAVPDLAPGDFRTVRQSMYYLRSELDNAALVAELEKEAAVKRAGVRRAVVGF